jgi:predicted regulator of Ras-like GTPase activity (Roadblock/LC7/MglB family)
VRLPDNMSQFINILHSIQTELGSDFSTAYIITSGGETLSKLNEIPLPTKGLSKANLAGVFKKVDEIKANLNAGPFEEALVTLARGYILIISLPGNAGYLILGVRRKEALSLAKLLAKEFANELASLINSD